MKKILLFAMMGMGTMNAQTTIFEDSFETYPDFAVTGIDGWTMIDGDMLPTYGFEAPTTFEGDFDPKAFQIFNSTATTPPLESGPTSDWTARTGTKSIVCIAAVPDEEGGPTQNDDWLISPQMTLGSAGNELTFWAKSCDTQFGDEVFSVLISTTGTAIDDFMAIEEGILSPADITYHEYTYDLSGFENMPVYFAIHCTSADMFGFMVDDFKVTTTDLGRADFFTSNFTAYPNPANNVLNINTKNGVQMDQIQLTDLNGRIVSNIAVNGVTETQVSMTDLASGVYFLKVQSNAGTGVHKIIKK